MDETTRAYIAGSLDGDGSSILQLKPRRDYVFGYQIKATVSLYQKRHNRRVLKWLNQQIGWGTVRDRPDGISEYDVEGLAQARTVLERVKPYVVLKAPQVEQALSLLQEMLSTQEATPEEFLRWAEVVETFQALNYFKNRRHSAADVRQYLESKGYLSPRND